MINEIQDKVLRNKRIGFDEGLYLLRDADLLALAPLATHVKNRFNICDRVTYVTDTNLNYTNLCDAYCSFCAFYRTDPTDPSAYTYSVEQIMEKVGRAAAKGVTTVLMQGGLNDELPYEYYLDMVEETVKRYPGMMPHYWSAPEIWQMCDVSGKPPLEVMQDLWDVGQRTMPGGGSEILNNRVKKIVSRFAPKDTWAQWTEIHEAAHEVGFKTTATMMYGHVETDEDIVETLQHIRDVQDVADANLSNEGGFTAFIPWSYKRENTALGKQVAEEAGPNRYLRVIALSRIYLDNVPHIQASWFSEGRKTGQMALHFGADDFGGTLFDENVMLAAGFYNRTTEDEVRELISDAGFRPAQRLTNYEIVREFEPGVSIPVGAIA